MKLYKLETRGIGIFHVVANDPTEAENRLKELLSQAAYGFTSDRVVLSIGLISQEVVLFGGAPKPCFSDDYKLILPDSCKV